MGDALIWGIKSSLFAYVRTVPDGAITLAEGAEVTATGEFRFPLDTAAPTDDDVLRYAGSVHWRAYDGLMDAALADPWIERAPTGPASLSAVVTLPGLPAERLTLALVDISPDSASAWRGSPVRLTADGALTLGALQYTEYQQVDDLRFTARR